MILRLERPSDYFEVENLIREAFWNVYKPGCDEHYVMHLLRNDPCFVRELDYVIEEDGIVVAHIAYSLGTLKKENGKTEKILLFGPVSVSPDKQRQGYGIRIITETLNKAKDLGYPCVVITGNPKYYHRFGFQSAHNLQIYHHDMPKDSPYFMVKVLNESQMKDFSGIYFDPTCYFTNKDEVEAYDQQFPTKIKQKKPGQLL